MFNSKENDDNNNLIFQDGGNKKTLWNPKSFLVISCLFSFLPAAIMYSINYKRLGYGQKWKKFLGLSIIGFVGTIVLFSLLPGNFGKYLGVGINAGIGGAMMKEQLPIFEEYIAKGGKKASLILPIILSTILMGLFLFPVFYAINIPESSKTFGDDEIYFTTSVTEKEINNLGDYLVNQEVFREDNSVMSLKLDKTTDNVYIISVIVDKESIDNPQTLSNFEEFGNYISQNVFNNSKVEIHLCDNRFKKLKVANPQGTES